MSTKTQKILSTSDYDLFKYSKDNRPLRLEKHRHLHNSMRLYGFLPCFPIVVYYDNKGRLIVKDGQHRLAIAEDLSLPVYYVVEETDFDVAISNNAQRPWVFADYAEKWAAQGKKEYQELLAFASRHKVPAIAAFKLLCGTVSPVYREEFVAGKFYARDYLFAEKAVGVYAALAMAQPQLRNAETLITACMMACRAEGFDPARLLKNLPRCLTKLKGYTNKDGYLDMMEEIYNFDARYGRLFPLKIEVAKAMRTRNPINKKKAAKHKSVTGEASPNGHAKIRAAA